ncbi:hypothetical protein cypCar_00026295 [Cyprinus carpio]|nr:hypothetical protein cypCar_00026295 [Cyprinus carpio]
MASRMGLVRGDIVVGKKQFSALLKHVYPTAVTAQNIKAGSRKAGIFPLSRAAVDTNQKDMDKVSKHTEKLLNHLRSTIIKMEFIKDESEDMKIEETFRVKEEDTETQTVSIWSLSRRSENFPGGALTFSLSSSEHLVSQRTQ